MGACPGTSGGVPAQASSRERGAGSSATLLCVPCWYFLYTVLRAAPAALFVFKRPQKAAL